MSVRPQLIEGARDPRRVSEAQSIRVGLYEKLKLDGTGSEDCYPELRRILLPKLFGKSERVPNRVPEGVQEGMNKTRSAAIWQQRPTLEKLLAIFQTVSPRSTLAIHAA